MTTKVFTGYFPAFPAKHLSEAQFRALGKKLIDAADPLVFGDKYSVENCWASQYLKLIPDLMPSDRAPAPDRFKTPQDMVRSNIAILQRFQWLAMAAADPEVDTWVWLEYTIMKQPGVTAAVIQKFLKDVETRKFDAISIPGCWPKGPMDDGAICWRFCGSAWVCPRKYARILWESVQAVVDLRTSATRTLSWDVNTLAYLELLDILPIRWYQGDHNATQLTNYIKG